MSDPIKQKAELYAHGVAQRLSAIEKVNRRDASEAARLGFIAGADSREIELIKLRFEIQVLRQWGNKDCTAMADEYLRMHRP